jgi:hypothetical protein
VPGKIFRGFALLARRDIFSSGIAHPRTTTRKGKPSGLLTSAVLRFSIFKAIHTKAFLDQQKRVG